MSPAQNLVKPGVARSSLAALAFGSGLGLLECTLRRPHAFSAEEAIGLAAIIATLHGGLALSGAVAAQKLPSLRGRIPGAIAGATFAFFPAIAFATSGFSGRFLLYCAAGASVAVLVRRIVARLPVASQSSIPWLVGAGAIAVISLWFGVTNLARIGKGNPPADGPSILLVTLDTTRADRIGAYGYTAAETPVLDSLARDGAWFVNAQTHSAWTGPSHATILSGLTPEEHGALVNMEEVSTGVESIVHALARAGYETSAFISGFPLVGGLGFIDAFDHYDDRLSGRRLAAFRGSTLGEALERTKVDDAVIMRRDAEVTTSRAIAWFEGQHDGPFFTWLHYYDPHLPYEQLVVPGPTEGHWYTLNYHEQRSVAQSPAAMAHMTALYDAQVTYVDTWLGRAIESARRAASGDLWILVTADHGESFDEHGIFFERDSYEVTGRVPLIVVPPSQVAVTRGQRDELVGLIDVAPTLLAAAGLETPPGLSGVDLSGPVGSRVLLRVHEPEELGGPSISARNGQYRLIERRFGREGRRFGGGERELYDLHSDPGETRNLAGNGVAAEASLLEHIERLDGSLDLKERVSPKLDEATERALRSLGYVR